MAVWVTKWMGAAGAISARSTKGMESPRALGASEPACDAPDGLSAGQVTRLGATGRVRPIVALVSMSFAPLTVSELGEHASIGAVRLGRVGQVRDVA
jgi:hypothetical protein